MSQLFLSTFLTNSLVINSTRPFFVASTSTAASIISGNNTAGTSNLIIYKGAIPDISTFTDRATRAADALITFTSGANSAGFSTVGVVNNSYRYQIGKFLASQQAAASGTATWFLLCRSGTTSLTDKGAMIGTVGLVGSGADLEIGDTNIVSGNNYQSAGFILNVPQIYTIP